MILICDGTARWALGSRTVSFEVRNIGEPLRPRYRVDLYMNGDQLFSYKFDNELVALERGCKWLKECE